MKDKLIFIISLLSLLFTCNSYSYTFSLCTDYALKSIRQFETNRILSCGFQSNHWNDNYDEHLKLCNSSPDQISVRIFRPRAQLIFNCLGEQNASLTEAEMDMLDIDLDDGLKKSIEHHDKKSFIRLLAAGASLESSHDHYINYYGGDDYYYYSISQGAVEITQLFLEHGVNPDRFITANKMLFHIVLNSTLYHIIENHHLLELFFGRDLEANLLLPREKHFESFLALALSEAVNDGDLKTTRALLKKGANPNFIIVKTSDDLLKTPLYRAINLLNVFLLDNNPSYELVDLLLKYGAYPNLFASNEKNSCKTLLNNKIIKKIFRLPLGHAIYDEAFHEELLQDLLDQGVSDRIIFQEVSEKIKDTQKIISLLKKAGAVSIDECRQKRDLLIAEVAVKHNGMALKYTDEEIRKNKKIVLMAVSQNGLALEFADKSFRKDRTIVMAAVKNTPDAFEFIDENLKRDKSIILQAIKSNVRAIYFIDKKLFDNDIVTAAGIKDPDEVRDIENQPINNKKDMLELLKHGNSLKLANNKLRDDKKVVLAAILANDSNYVFASKRLKNDKDIMFAFYNNYPDGINLLDEKFRDDLPLMLKLVSKKGHLLKYVSHRLKKDRQIVLAAIEQDGSALEFADDIFKKDRVMVSLAIKQNVTNIQYADASLKKDKQIVMAAIKKDGYALRYVDHRYQKDKAIVMLAVKNSAYALQYADKTLKADRDVVLQAVKHYGYAFEFAAEELKKDKDIALTAIKSESSAIKYAHKSLLSDREFVLAVTKIAWLSDALDPSFTNDAEIALEFVKRNGLKLDSFSKKLQSDKKIVKLAVENDGLALKYTTPELQKDPEIVSIAIKQNILALKYAGEPLRQNKQWILQYVKKSKRLPKWTNQKLKQDRDFIQAILNENINPLIEPGQLKDRDLVLAAIKIDGMALRYADANLKKDKELVLAAVKQEAEAFQYADKHLLEDKSVVLEAIKLNGRAYYFASKQVQSDKDVMLAALRQDINVLRLLTKQDDSMPCGTSDTDYSIQRIDLEKPLVLNKLTNIALRGNFVFSPNGLLFAAATELSTGRAQIKIWSTENGKLRYSSIIKNLPVSNYQGLVFSPDSKRLINIDESEDYGFIWNFYQGDDPFPCSTGIELKEISSQTHSMLTNPADAPMGLFSLKDCKNLGFSPEFITTSPYVISPDNKMIIRENTFINNEKYEQILVEWNKKKKILTLTNHNYINKKILWKKSFPHSKEPLDSGSYYPDYKTRKLFYFDKKYIWIVNIDTGKIINKFPLPKNTALTKLTLETYSQPFFISNDNKIMVINTGTIFHYETIELISLETGKIIHIIDYSNNDNIYIPPPTPEGVPVYCSRNFWSCSFDIKTSVSPNGQFIQYGKPHASSMLIDSQNDKLILKVSVLVRSNMSESKTGETMFMSMQHANEMTLWKIKRTNKLIHKNLTSESD